MFSKERQLSYNTDSVKSGFSNQFLAMADNIVNLQNDDNYRISQGSEARESFEDLLRYDLQDAWSCIFDICVSDNNGIIKNGYYNPECLAIDDKYIIPDAIKLCVSGNDMSLV